jgi:hypothetical protein
LEIDKLPDSGPLENVMASNNPVEAKSESLDNAYQIVETDVPRIIEYQLKKLMAVHSIQKYGNNNRSLIIDLAECRKMPYLCGMKTFAVLVLISLNSQLARSQVEGGDFNPQDGGPMYVPAGASVVYKTSAHVDIKAYGNVGSADFVLDSCIQATITPAGFWAGRGPTNCNVQITIKSDTPECYPGCYQGYGIMASEVSNSSMSFFYSFGPVVFYDPHIIGHAKIYSNHFPSSDSVSFYNTPVNDSAWSSFHVVLDSLGQYRKFRVLHVSPPFRIDSIFLQYPCSYNSSDPNTVWFSPPKPGHYIDTVYILDPLTNDSLPLILIGEGVAASVSNSLVEASRVAISPNPCDKHCTLSMSGGQIEHVIVRNLLGESVLDIPSMRNEDFTLSTAGLPNGIYFIEVRSNENVYRERVIVAH